MTQTEFPEENNNDKMEDESCSSPSPRNSPSNDNQDSSALSPITTEGSCPDHHGQSTSNELRRSASGTRVGPCGIQTDDIRTKSTEVERRSLDAGEKSESLHDDGAIPNSFPPSKENNTSESKEEGNVKMEEEPAGVSPAGSSPQRQEPDGAMPRHRIGESRRFSQDLNELMSTDEDDAKASLSNGGKSSPPQALKEISISRDPSVTDDDDDDDPLDAGSQPTESLLNQSSASNSQPPQPIIEEPHHQERTPLETTWRQGLNLSMEDAPRLPDPSHQRPPPNTPEQPPLPMESDMSVFSIHSGYAMQDPNGYPPRIVPGNIIQNPAFQQYPHQIQHPMYQSQHSMGSTNGYPPHQQHQYQHQHSFTGAPVPHQVAMGPPSVGKRKVHFRLVEDIPAPSRKRSFLGGFRRSSSRNLLSVAASPMPEEQPRETDRGRITVSWYEGTTTLELMEHVRNAVMRKLGLQGTTKLAEIRILDESSNPPEEIVLTPHIPSGSRLLLRFNTRDAGGDVTPPYGRQSSYHGGAPESPSAAPSPLPSSLDLQGLGLNSHQLALLGTRLKGVQMPTLDSPEGKQRKSSSTSSTPPKKSTRIIDPKPELFTEKMQSKEEKEAKDDKSSKEEDDGKDDQSSVFEMQSLHPEDPIQKSLQNITELLMRERERSHYIPKQQKRQVIFIIANYFVLFLSVIAILAEIQARAPEWNASIERHFNSVKNCSKDQDALFECVSNGDFSGLVASVVLWISRSAATKRIFLFGFDTPRKLWTVVYESLVSALCWGFSYMFIRRGMNPDTNRNFLQKYWKDAVYGSLAGFNANFMKQVLKNLVPQEAIEDALQERQLKILSWLPSFA
mmetsp:Transcript_17624/g.50724  ORF Transcript_17624/g.50724 Transcript_17624/m.50724 type:complete len:845 (+) Transcript_17624:211-2745(+)|eukprot:CAMPEP_0176016780 /NCGR_PEP_ID=MMETSP0120_2-20121206/8026_1 /TAXON_ID=160619 /ORGANISM="Kryptoperidinium foliaceum, Strain CCMP 1326" /LENGTH=844 /DNA_ID=CAMNT_0017349785 /DNA_START=182 /DNA_END=2716 /DNA_ORIENTATION=-